MCIGNNGDQRQSLLCGATFKVVFDGLQGGPIKSIAAADGKLDVGHSSGLYISNDDKSFVRYSGANGLPGNVIENISISEGYLIAGPHYQASYIRISDLDF